MVAKKRKHLNLLMFGGTGQKGFRKRANPIVGLVGWVGGGRY